MSNIELNNKDFTTLLKENQQQLIDRILNPSFWNKDEIQKWNLMQ